MNSGKVQVGEMARRIRNALGSHGEMSAIDLEMMVGASSQLLDFALGSLAREDQVEIVSETDGTTIRLKFD